MSQSRKGSAFEAVMNVAVGIGVSLTANALIFPLFGWEISASQNIAMSAIYTVISLARSYCIRRWFNGFRHA